MNTKWKATFSEAIQQSLHCKAVFKSFSNLTSKSHSVDQNCPTRNSWASCSLKEVKFAVCRLLAWVLPPHYPGCCCCQGLSSPSLLWFPFAAPTPRGNVVQPRKLMAWGGPCVVECWQNGRRPAHATYSLRPLTVNRPGLDKNLAITGGKLGHLLILFCFVCLTWEYGSFLPLSSHFNLLSLSQASYSS